VQAREVWGVGMMMPLAARRGLLRMSLLDAAILLFRYMPPLRYVTLCNAAAAKQCCLAHAERCLRASNSAMRYAMTYAAALEAAAASQISRPPAACQFTYGMQRRTYALLKKAYALRGATEVKT